MSRSRKKSHVVGNTTSKSEKWWKRLWHKAFRQAERQTIKQLDFIDPDEIIEPIKDEVANVWDGPKDGKHYYKDLEESWPEYFDKLMRK